MNKITTFYPRLKSDNISLLYTVLLKCLKLLVLGKLDSPLMASSQTPNIQKVIIPPQNTSMSDFYTNLGSLGFPIR